jgi:hypothetical protein
MKLLVEDAVDRTLRLLVEAEGPRTCMVQGVRIGGGTGNIAGGTRMSSFLRSGISAGRLETRGGRCGKLAAQTAFWQSGCPDLGEAAARQPRRVWSCPPNARAYPTSASWTRRSALKPGTLNFFHFARHAGSA